MSSGTATRDEPARVEAIRAAARKKRQRKGGLVWSVLAWVLALGFFFPVLWMVLTSFKQETDA